MPIELINNRGGVAEWHVQEEIGFFDQFRGIPAVVAFNEGNWTNNYMEEFFEEVGKRKEKEKINHIKTNPPPPLLLKMSQP